MTASEGNDRHVALIVEDDPRIAEILKEFVLSLGHEWRHAATLEEVRAEIATGGYCYVLLDLQIPAGPAMRASVGCGETALASLRRAAPERTTEGKYALPVLVVTGYSRDPEFISKMYDDHDVNGYITKPFGDRTDLILDKIRKALARSERADHGACVAAREKGSRGDGAAHVHAPLAPAVRIAIDGQRAAARTDVIVNGARGSLQDMHFAVFLNLVVGHLQTPGSWVSAAKSGIARNEKAPSRIRAGLRGVLPAGFALVETQKTVGFRIHPAVVVERVEWGMLAEHGNPAVRKVAEVWRATEGARGRVAGV